MAQGERRQGRRPTHARIKGGRGRDDRRHGRHGHALNASGGSITRGTEHMDVNSRGLKVRRPGGRTGRPRIRRGRGEDGEGSEDADTNYRGQVDGRQKEGGDAITH